MADYNKGKDQELGENKLKGQIKVEKNVDGIEGLCVITPAVHGDNRGYFMETYSQRDMEENGIDIVFVQDNQSSSSKVVNSIFLVHNGIQCEKCKISPIIGNRYKCPKCLNYNLCEDCEEKNGEMGFHPHSDFILYRISETPITSNDFSYDCLTNDLEIHQNFGIDSFDVKLKLKNTGYLEWPISSCLKCRKELSTIFCDKCELPSIKMNEETDIDLKFSKCNKIPKGTYSCYVNCIIEDKIRRGPIIIKVFIE